MSNSWWDKHLGPVIGPGETTTPFRQTVRKAVQWQQPQQNYPAMRRTPSAEEIVNDPNYVLSSQGYVHKAPGSARENLGNCPECDSPNFFSRKVGVTRGPPPAPLCAECGYNGGLFEQSGSILNGAGVISSGPTHNAVSDNPGGISQMDWSRPIHVPGT